MEEQFGPRKRGNWWWYAGGGLVVILLLLGILNSFQIVRFTIPGDEEAESAPKSMVKNGVDFSDGKSVDVIDYEGHYLLVKDLRVGPSHPPHATGSGCPAQHWHADRAVIAVNDGSTQSDPNGGGCGFGTLAERPVMMYFPNELLAD